jgi:hypothetical protein
MKMALLYMSGAIGGFDNKREAYQYFNEFAKKWIELGHKVLIPLDRQEKNYSGNKNGRQVYPYSTKQLAKLKEDLKIVFSNNVDGVLLLPNWGYSIGCSFELFVFSIIGLPIYDATKPVADLKDGLLVSPRFAVAQYFLELFTLYNKKQFDYGTLEDPMANIKSSNEYGIPPLLGVFLRMNDKIARLKSFARKGKLLNESVCDTLNDIAVYAIIGKTLLMENDTTNELKKSLEDHINSEIKLYARLAR